MKPDTCFYFLLACHVEPFGRVCPGHILCGLWCVGANQTNVCVLPCLSLAHLFHIQSVGSSCKSKAAGITEHFIMSYMCWARSASRKRYKNGLFFWGGGGVALASSCRLYSLLLALFSWNVTVYEGNRTVIINSVVSITLFLLLRLKKAADISFLFLLSNYPQSCRLVMMMHSEPDRWLSFHFNTLPVCLSLSPSTNSYRWDILGFFFFSCVMLSRVTKVPLEFKECFFFFLFIFYRCPGTKRWFSKWRQFITDPSESGLIFPRWFISIYRCSPPPSSLNNCKGHSFDTFLRLGIGKGAYCFVLPSLSFGVQGSPSPPFF